MDPVLPQESAVRVEHLYTMIAGVGYDDVALVVDHHSLGPQERLVAVVDRLAGQRARAREPRVDQYQRVVVEVADDQAAVGREADAARRVEILPHVRRVFVAVLAQEHAVGAEQLHPVVPSVRDRDLALRVHRHVPGIIELAVFVALLAEAVHERTVHLKNLKRVTS